MSEKINWRPWMDVGLRTLGLQPNCFWSLTPAELMFLIGQFPQENAFGRDQLSDLCARFPDEKRTEQ